MIVAILLMAGSGTRSGSQIPTQSHHLSGKKIHQHTLDKFLNTQLFSRIILVCAPEYIKQIQKENSFKNQVYVVEGGQNRQAASLKGLLACPSHTEIVVIHDAVRPFVSEEILQKNEADLIFVARELLRNPFLAVQSTFGTENECFFPTSYERAR